MRRSGWLLLAAALAAGTSACRPEIRGNGWNVLLVTLETTRADHLGSYGYERDTSPALDALAEQGVLFEQVSAVSPRTNPSLASLMTAAYPHEHGVRNLLIPLEPGNRTLAEVLRDAGYRTGAIQTHPRLVAASGFAQGFDRYDDDIAAHPLADQACEAAFSWIERAAVGSRPWFMWLHLMDPHWTYDPPSPWRTRFGADDPRPAGWYRAIEEGRERMGDVIFRNRMPEDEVAAFVDFYDAEIRFTDHALGVLLERLEESGLAERTLVVVTADHGESLGEHDYYFEHGDFGTEPEIHIPLIIRAPDGLGAGGRVRWTVANTDVAPTILDLVTLPGEEAFVGESLRATMRRPDVPADRLRFGETGHRFHEQNDRREVEGVEGKWRWARRGRFKMMHRPTLAGGATRSLYDLELDPGETTDIALRHPKVFAELEASLDAWLAEDEGEPRELHLTPELRDVLRSLGYVD